MCWYVLACLCLHYLCLGIGRGESGMYGVVSLSHTAQRGGEGLVLNLINSCFKLTGEINCRMKHKQKPTTTTKKKNK